MSASHHYLIRKNTRLIHLYITRPFHSGWSLLPTVEQFLTFVKSDTRRPDELDQVAGNLYEFLYDALDAAVRADWGYPNLNEFIPRVITFFDQCGPQISLVWKQDQDYGVMFVASRVAMRWLEDINTFYADRS